jgi:hypothetical protein
MRKRLLTLCVAQLKQNNEAVFENYELLFTETYIALLIQFY